MRHWGRQRHKLKPMLTDLYAYAYESVLCSVKTWFAHKRKVLADWLKIFRLCLHLGQPCPR